MTEVFESRGLSIYSNELPSDEIEVLGTRLDMAYSSGGLTAGRFWRMKEALAHAVRRRALGGRTLEILIGHATFCNLARRQLLSVFHSTYRFSNACFWERSAIWPSVRDKLRAFSGLPSLSDSDWNRP